MNLLLEPTEWSLLCRRALVFISLYISEHRHSVCMLLHTQNRATRSLMLSMRRGSCAATQQLKNPTNCSFLTSDRARIAVALGSLKTLDAPCQPQVTGGLSSFSLKPQQLTYYLVYPWCLVNFYVTF